MSHRTERLLMDRRFDIRTWPDYTGSLRRWLDVRLCRRAPNASPPRSRSRCGGLVPATGADATLGWTRLAASPPEARRLVRASAGPGLAGSRGLRGLTVSPGAFLPGGPACQPGDAGTREDVRDPLILVLGYAGARRRVQTVHCLRYYGWLMVTPADYFARRW